MTVYYSEDSLAEESKYFLIEYLTKDGIVIERDEVTFYDKDGDESPASVQHAINEIKKSKFYRIDKEHIKQGVKKIKINIRRQEDE